MVDPNGFPQPNVATAALPFPIDLDLPAGWTPVAPAAAGEPQAGYVAVRAADTDRPVPTSLVLSGLTVPANQVDLRALAGSHVERLRSHLEVTVLSREADADGRQAAQLLRIAGGPVPLNQIQIVMAFPDAADPAVIGLLQIMLSCPEDVLGTAGPEFRGIVASIRPATAQPEQPTQATEQ